MTTKAKFLTVNCESLDFKVYQVNPNDATDITFSISDHIKLKKGTNYSTDKLAKAMLWRLHVLYKQIKDQEIKLTALKKAELTRLNPSKLETFKGVKLNTAFKPSRSLYFSLSWQGMEIDSIRIDSVFTQKLKMIGESAIQKTLIYLSGMLNVYFKSLDIKTFTDIDNLYSGMGVEINTLMMDSDAGIKLLDEAKELLNAAEPASGTDATSTIETLIP